MTNGVAALRNIEWSQGDLLTDEHVKSLRSCGALKADVLFDYWIVISHDCDLAADLSVEPIVELIGAKKLGEETQQVDSNAKTARRLDLTLASSSGAKLKLKLSAISKVMIPKEQLWRHSAKSPWLLSESDLQVLRRWLAVRYRRSAFPEAFNRRLDTSRFNSKRNLAEQIKHLSCKEPVETFLRGVFFQFLGSSKLEIIDSQTPYKIIIWLVYSSASDAAEASAHTKTLATDITNAFDKTQWSELGEIELQACNAVSDAVITVSQLDGLQKWDHLDSVSIAKSPQSLMPSD